MKQKHLVIRVVNPSVLPMQSVPVAQDQFAMCATGCSLSRGKLRAFEGGTRIIGAGDLIYGDPEPYSNAERLIEKVLEAKPFKHESVLEHGSIGFTFRVSRIVTHQMVRHRIGAFTQESTRYVFHKNEATLIRPFNTPASDVGVYEYHYEGAAVRSSDVTPSWVDVAAHSLINYNLLISGDLTGEPWKREYARYLLPQTLAAWIQHTTNFRQWRHEVALRTDKHASPEIRYVYGEVKRYLEEVSPVLVSNMPGGNSE